MTCKKTNYTKLIYIKQPLQIWFRVYPSPSGVV